MIYTVTFNPSLDYIVSVPEFQLGLTNRTKEELLLPGGKGINVSTVLQNLGIENTALGFIAGFVGEEIRREVEDLGVNAEFISLPQGISRINLKLRSVDGTEINGNGPTIPAAAVEQLMDRLERLESGDTLVLAGSIPSSMPDDIYRQIMEQLAGKGVYIAVDATKDLLLNVLELHPFLIKPNNHGLAGVIIGTIACMILPDLLIEPYVVYRYIFHKKTVVYYRKYFFFLLSLMVMFPFLELGSRLEVLSFGGLLLKGLVFAGVSVVYVLLIGWIACRKELAFFGRLAKGVVTWRIKRD